MLIILLFFCSIFFEVYTERRTSLSSRTEKTLLSISALLIGFITGVLLIESLSIFSLLFLLVCSFRLLVIARHIMKRMSQQELTRRMRRSNTILYVTSFVLLVCSQLFNFALLGSKSITIISIAQLFGAVLVGVSIVYSRQLYRYKNDSVDGQKTLPSVTVCVPARNETDDLPLCIESILNSNYPKLEVLVLDDCSHDKTPEIIKHYAHAGVRFIKGQEPDESWVAKNAAYHKLAQEAKGDVLLFMGVDIRLQPESIANIVSQLYTIDMVSILPKRSLSSEFDLFIQPIRYWWELGLWRFVTKKPAVLSSLWAIRATTLRKMGGFTSVKKSIEPEVVFARATQATKTYQFIISNKDLPVESTKKPKEQFQTALRKRYPQVKRQPENVLFLLLAELLFFFGPLIMLIYAAITKNTLLIILSLLSCSVLSVCNAVIYRLATKNIWIVGLFSGPLLVISDWVLLIRSMLAYEFGKVIWKERNVCIPILNIEKSLPKL